MNGRPSRSFDRIADRYDDSRGGAERGVILAADLQPWLLPGTVLEVGVGTGVVSAALRALGFTVFGADLSAGMLRHARQRLGPSVVQADATALPFTAAAVDNVVFVTSLHAIGDVYGAVAEAARVVRPGGRVIAVHGIPRRLPDDDDLTAAVAPLNPLRDDRPDSAPALDGAAAAADLRPAGVSWVASTAFAESPNEFAKTIEERLWSYLWSVDDTVWRDVVVPVVARLRALPDPDRPRPYHLSPRLVAYSA
ncbi:class I SAM-dependent methyltransferase [Dactylosporangium sp. NPDC005572]|uniref:class I SAM-dependent methyltransferase n=1 Tax=Dactylosporangium sp. NPDC005572 TaxID=3156889 RepID=UPI0033BE258C